MDTYWLQQLIVYIAVLAAAWYCFTRFMPRTRAALVRWLGHGSRPAWLRGWATRLQAQAGGACDDGCGTCGQCGPAKPRTIHIVRGPVGRGQRAAIDTPPRDIAR